MAGADAMGGVEQNLATIQGQIDANRDLSASLSYDALHGRAAPDWNGRDPAAPLPHPWTAGHARVQT